jgi:hypothetical protein
MDKPALLLSLIGEQPIPVLLVARELTPERHILLHTDRTAKIAENLKEILPGAELQKIDGYDLLAAIQTIQTFQIPGTLLNLTAGTKPMAFAAYEVARSQGLPVVYLQSEKQNSVLYAYEFRNGTPQLSDRSELGPLITIKDYLRAHGLSEWLQDAPANAQETGLRQWFEDQVDECISNIKYPVFEIDFVLRRGNQVAIVEAKHSKKTTRVGIDQLNTAGGRAYLGIYTGKILVIEKALSDELNDLAAARNIKVVVVNSSVNNMTGRKVLTKASQKKLLVVLDKVLGTR